MASVRGSIFVNLLNDIQIPNYFDFFHRSFYQKLYPIETNETRIRPVSPEIAARRQPFYRTIARQPWHNNADATYQSRRNFFLNHCLPGISQLHQRNIDNANCI